MALAVRSVGAFTSTTAQTIEVVPGTIVDDDILLLVAYAGDNVDLTTPEAGFSTTIQIQRTGSDAVIGFWTKTASSESGDYTVNISGGANRTMKGVILAISGGDTSTHLDQTSVTKNTETNSTTQTPPAITTQTDLARVFCIAGAIAAVNTAAHTPPSGYDDHGESASTNHFLGVASISVTPAGTETPGSWSGFGSTSDHMSITLAIKPAAVGGGRIMASLAYHGGLAGPAGIAGSGGGLAG